VNAEPVTVSTHAIERFQEVHPDGERFDVLAAWRNGTPVPAQLAASLTSTQQRANGDSEYRWSPCRRLLIVTTENKHYRGGRFIVTCLRLYPQQIAILDGLERHHQEDTMNQIKADGKPRGPREAVLELLAEGAADIGKIRSVTHLGKPATQDLVRQLRAAGEIKVVQHNGRPHWVLTGAGDSKSATVAQDDHRPTRKSLVMGLLSDSKEHTLSEVEAVLGSEGYAVDGASKLIGRLSRRGLVEYVSLGVYRATAPSDRPPARVSRKRPQVSMFNTVRRLFAEGGRFADGRNYGADDVIKATGAEVRQRATIGAYLSTMRKNGEIVRVDTGLYRSAASPAISDRPFPATPEAAPAARREAPRSVATSTPNAVEMIASLPAGLFAEQDALIAAAKAWQAKVEDLQAMLAGAGVLGGAK
jgi:hypothetical protein